MEQRSGGIADGHDCPVQMILGGPQIDGGARLGRVVALGELGQARLLDVTDDLHPFGQSGTDDAGRRHGGVAQDVRARRQRTTRGLDHTGGEGDVTGNCRVCCGVDHSHDDSLDIGGESRKIRFLADDTE